MGVRITSDQLELLEDGRSRARVDAGKKAQRTGQVFEAELDVFHKTYRNDGFAWLKRNELPTRPAPRGRGDKGPQRRIVTGSAPYDFDGALGPSSPFPGRMVAIEAKHTSSKPKTIEAYLSMKGPKQKQGLGRDQLDYLADLYWTYNAVTGLVWRCVDVVGFMDGRALWEFRRQLLHGGTTRLGASRFTWLPQGELDYLRPLTKALVEPG